MSLGSIKTNFKHNLRQEILFLAKNKLDIHVQLPYREFKFLIEIGTGVIFFTLIASKVGNPFDVSLDSIKTNFKHNLRQEILFLAKNKLYIHVELPCWDFKYLINIGLGVTFFTLIASKVGNLIDAQQVNILISSIIVHVSAINIYFTVCMAKIVQDRIPHLTWPLQCINCHHRSPYMVVW